MPQEEFAIVDELLQEIILIAQIEKGLQELEDGKVISEEELDKDIV